AARIQQIQQGAAQAQQAYAQAVAQAHEVALNFTVGQFPELRGISLEALPQALKVLEQSNPQRYTQVVTHLAHLDQVSKANQAVQQQQAQQVAAQVRDWTIAQDKAVDAYLAQHESPELVRSVKDSLPQVLSHFGVNVDEFRQAVAQVPLLRSAPMQRMLFELGKQFVLRESAAEKVSRPVPIVQRPG